MTPGSPEGVHRHRLANGLTVLVAPDDLDGCAAAQGVGIRKGDFVIVRTGHQERCLDKRPCGEQSHRRRLPARVKQPLPDRHSRCGGQSQRHLRHKTVGRREVAGRGALAQQNG